MEQMTWTLQQTMLVDQLWTSIQFVNSVLKNQAIFLGVICAAKHTLTLVISVGISYHLIMELDKKYPALYVLGCLQEETIC